jgi:predicted alpha/beta-fold hydrolase
MITESAFKPAWWLTGAHAQTLVGAGLRQVASPVNRMERLELPDGDFVDLAWADDHLEDDAPLVVILHGLVGSYRSSYIAAQMRQYHRLGWRSVVMHFRGASGVPNRLLRLYHGGDTGDLHYVLQTLVAREPHSRKWLVGFSLGANVMLKWLGEQGQQNWVSAAVSVSAPLELSIVADQLNQGFSRIYQSYFLKQLRHMLRPKMIGNPEHAALLKSLESARCFWAFDETITAPLHGFPNAHTYYRESSAKFYLTKIATPTLIIHAADDPLMTQAIIPNAAELSPHVTLELSAHGGHLGFVTGTIPGRPLYWLDQRIPAYFTGYLGA